MSNYHLRDKELSYGAIGLLCKVMSLPEDWEYSVNGLVTVANTNKKEVQKLLKELEKFGYLERNRVQNTKGRFEYTYQFYEKPRPLNRDTDNRGTENRRTNARDTDNRGTENDPQLNTNKSITKELNIKEIKINKEIKDSNRTEFDSIIDTFEDEKIKVALKDFIRMRFANGKKLNTAIFKMLTDQLKKMTSNQSEQLDIINNSLMNGWNVFYPLDKNPNSLKIIKPTNDDDVQIEHEDVSDEELLELQRSLRGDA